MNVEGARIITFGAATQDVFLYGPSLHAHRGVGGHGYVESFPLGAKVEVEHIYYDVGGGATNAAVTFARQGIEVDYVGKLGRDAAGAEVLRVLRHEGVGVDLVTHDSAEGTGFSALLLAPTGERTVLVYRGASTDLKAADVPIRTLEADWFYITSLSGNLDLLAKLLKHANLHGIKVALDPGSKELAKVKQLRSLLPLVTVIKANAGELKQLFGGESLRDTVRSAAGVCPIVVGTNGSNGVYAATDGKLYRAGVYKKVKVVDRTGAGDAFGSGFVAGLARDLPVEDALTLAAANATGVVATLGAKQGIIKTKRLRRMKIEVESL